MPKPPRKWVATTEYISTYAGFENAYRGDRVVFIGRLFKGKPVSARVVANMSYDLVVRMLARGEIFLCKMSPEYEEWLRKEMLT